jgi:hypothetical protein
MNDPDYIYDPDDWEVTVPWADRHDIVESADIRYGHIKRFATLIHGSDKWVADIVLSWDDDGDPDETEIRWFNSESEAKQALTDSLASRKVKAQ